MITLRKLAKEIIELESGGSPSIDSNLSEAYVVQYVRQMTNAVLLPKVYERLQQDDRSGLQLMLASYEVSVQGEGSTKYIDLPEFYVNLPFNKGLHQISPIDDPTNAFIPRLNPAVSNDLPCADLDPGQYSYWAKGKKVFFDNDIEFAKVLVDLLVASPDSVGVDDALPIYPEQQIEVIQRVRDMLKTMPPQDKRLDSNPDLGIKIQAR